MHVVVVGGLYLVIEKQFNKLGRLCQYHKSGGSVCGDEITGQESKGGSVINAKPVRIVCILGQKVQVHSNMIGKL